MALIKVRTDEQVGQDIRGVGPTLLVGLGGTGKDVLLRLRRLLVEHYGGLENLPFIRFLHIDTDQTQEAKEQYDLKAQDDPLYNRVAFSRNELIDLHILGGTGQIIHNIDKYEHIRDWFQVEGMVNLGDLGKGAGQIRMASRLAFYLKAGEIKDHVQRVAGELLQANIQVQAQQLGFNVNPQNRDIYVVGSLAGGTGSGIFIDVGFLLKQTMHDFSRSGIFVLPSAFTGVAGENRLKANGYAALMELNNYSFGNSFCCQWGKMEKTMLSPPPYDTTYLIDSENGAKIVAQPNELYQMIAESLFHEFSLGNFADKKRSVRVNLAQFTQNAYIDHFWEKFEGEGGSTERTMLGDAFTLRFSSFGMAAILLPVDKIWSACACRLGREIIDLWQQQVSHGLVEDLYTRFLNREEVRFAQGDINLRDGSRFKARQLEEEILWQNKGAGITYDQFFRKKIQELVGELRTAPMKSKSERLQRFLTDVEGWFGKEDSDRDEDWGQITRHIAANAEEYLKRLKKGIRAECERLANSSRYGIAYVLALLRELKMTLSSELENIWYSSYFDKEMKNWTDSIVYYKSQLDSVARELNDHEGSFLFRGDNVNRDIVLLCGETPDDRGLLDHWLYSRLHRLKANWGKSICEAIDGFLGKDDVNSTGLIAEYRKLLQFLDEFKARLGRLEDYFKRDHPYSIYKNLLAPDDFNRWYNIWVGGDAERPNFGPRLLDFANEVLANVFESESVTAALSMIQVSTAEKFENRILSHCRSQLKHQLEQPSVLRALFQNQDERQREQIVGQAFNQAKAQLHPPTDLGHVAYEAPRANQAPYYIGLDTTDPFASQLDATLRRVVPPGDRWEMVSLGEQNKGAIVFFNELSGVPAFYPRSVSTVNGMREWYRIYFTDPQKVDPKNLQTLHTHKNRFLFGDIIPKTREQQERYKYAVRSFVLGRILDILRAAEDGDAVRYTYVDDSIPWKAPDIIFLGRGENEAVDFFYQRDQSPPESAIYIKLDRKIEDDLRRLQSAGLLIVYILLLEFYKKAVYAPEAVRDLRDVELQKYSPQYAAIAQELKRIAKRCSETGLDNELSQARWRITGGRRELSARDYVEVLKPYCREEGVYAERVENAVGSWQIVNKKALVFDREGFMRWLSTRPGFQPAQSGPQQHGPQQGTGPAMPDASPRGPQGSGQTGGGPETYPASAGPGSSPGQQTAAWGPGPAQPEGGAWPAPVQPSGGPAGYPPSPGPGSPPGAQGAGWGPGPAQPEGGAWPAPVQPSGGPGSYPPSPGPGSPPGAQGTGWGPGPAQPEGGAWLAPVQPSGGPGSYPPSSAPGSPPGGQASAWGPGPAQPQGGPVPTSGTYDATSSPGGQAGETVRCPRCNNLVPKGPNCTRCNTVLHV